MTFQNGRSKQVAPGFSLGELRKKIEDFRSKIEPCWCEETAYMIPEIQTYGAFIPAGQCAVTALVLKEVLENTFPELYCQLVSGSLETTSGKVLIPDHSWLKVSIGGDELLIDVTADQSEFIHDKVVMGKPDELQASNLHYKEKEVEDGYGEVEHPKRFQRFNILRNRYESHPG